MRYEALNDVIMAWRQNEEIVLSDLTIVEWFAGRYQIEEHIGSGSTSLVFKATDTRLGRNVAIKVFYTNDQTYSNNLIINEARTLASVNHPLINKVYDIGFDESNGCMWIALELLIGPTLREYANLSSKRGFDFDKFIQTGLSICDVIEYLHDEYGQFQLDLKPDNFIYNPITDTLTMVDVGTLIKESICKTTFYGTPGYIAPELLSGGTASKRTDIFSFGVILIELITGFNPIMDIQSKINKSPDYRLDHPTCPIDSEAIDLRAASNATLRNYDLQLHRCKAVISEPLADKVIELLAQMCSLNPELRPAIDQIRSTLIHLRGMYSDSMPSVFVSHSYQDEQFVRKLVRKLKASGIKTWVYYEQIQAGETIWNKLYDVIDNTDYFIIIISKNSLSSRAVSEELVYAITKKLGQESIIPIRIDDTKYHNMPAYIQLRKVQDFSLWGKRNAWDKSCDELLSRLTKCVK